MNKIKSIGFALGLSIATNSIAEDKKEGSSVFSDCSNITSQVSLSTQNALINTQDVCKKLTQELNTTYASQLSGDQKEIIIAILNDKDFQKNLTKDLQESTTAWTSESIIKGLIFLLIYGVAYYPTLRFLAKGEKSISALSFTGFAIASAGSAMMNGFVPGSLVYSETFILASIAVALELRNRKKNSKKVSLIPEGKTYKSEKITDNEISEITIMKSKFPIVLYDENDAPLLWNKKMEEISGYTFEEIQEYYKEHGEVMSLLYKGEDYVKVMQYLNDAKNKGIGYESVAFTLTTKSGKEVTILWSNEIIHGKQSLRMGRVLEKEEEILLEKKHTIELLGKIDGLTGLLNRVALEESLEKINQEKIPKIVVYFDIDKFKNINDGFGHECGDEIIKHVVSFFKKHLRENDTMYRTGGDEFCIIFAGNEHGYEKVMEKLNTIRGELAKNGFYYEGKKVALTISIGGDIVDPRIKPLTTSDINAIDKNMYILKTLDHLGDALDMYGIEQKLPSRNGLCFVIYGENGKKEKFQIYGDFPTFQVPYELLEISIKRREELANKNK